MTNTSQNFWEFSVELYSSAGISTACLKLQNEYGIDVNLLLLCCWHGIQFGQLSETALEEAISFSKRWRQEVVQPLRESRKWMKLNTPSVQGPDEQGERLSFAKIREEIKHVELKAEKHQQSVLQNLVVRQQPAESESGSGSGSIDAVNWNVLEMLKQVGVANNADLRATFAILAAAIK